MTDGFRFRASLQDRSGISFDQDEATIRLKVPKIDIPQMVGMIALTDCVLDVTVTVLQNNTDQEHAPEPMAKRTKRQSRRTPPNRAGDGDVAQQGAG